MTTAATLAEGYRECARLTRRYGTTYYWGARLLKRQERLDVYAVYALCRLADDIVDGPQATADAATVTRTRLTLNSFQRDFEAATYRGEALTPVLAAIGHSVRRRGIQPECFHRFFRAMSMDLDTNRYETWDDLLTYMDGSAAVIGEMMLPVLQPRSASAHDPARALGLAFQLTNFLRDVGEDLDRGRVYLPQEDLRRFGADPYRRTVDEAWRRLMRFEIARNQELYREADAGIALLSGASARCVSTARVLYADILTRIEAADYDVFSARQRVPTRTKAWTAARGLIVSPRPRDLVTQ